MLSAVKMEGHEAPDWSGFYSEEVGELSTRTRPEQKKKKALKVGDDKVCEKASYQKYGPIKITNTSQGCYNYVCCFYVLFHSSILFQIRQKKHRNIFN